MSDRDKLDGRANIKANSKFLDGIMDTRKKIAQAEQNRGIRGDFTRHDPKTGSRINMNEVAPGGIASLVAPPETDRKVFTVPDWKGDAKEEKMVCPCGGGRGFNLSIKGNTVIRTCKDCDEKVDLSG